MTDKRDGLYPLRAVNRPLDARYANARIADVSLADVMSHRADMLCGCGVVASTACKECGEPLCGECSDVCVDCHEPLCEVCAIRCFNCGNALCVACLHTGYVQTLAESFCESCYGDLDLLEDEDDDH